MHITPAVIAEVERKYGHPREISLDFEMQEREFRLLERARSGGRVHDVTLFIFKGVAHGARSSHIAGMKRARRSSAIGRRSSLFEGVHIAVIRKHAYPPGIFRPPSGGIHPGESFEAGARREAYEETGLHIELHRYLLRARVSFVWRGERADWTSHVFAAHHLGGDIHPVDRGEIAEAFWVSVDELKASTARLRATPLGGLHYRAALNEQVLSLYEKGCEDA
ncbi:MAG: NUDIX hydrolase [Acidobacteria bacterium]|nr:MAG: NUDIX hydrolase [Acidobacteriota bacterium]